jgi:hypothetical protein
MLSEDKCSAHTSKQMKTSAMEEGKRRDKEYTANYIIPKKET